MEYGYWATKAVATLNPKAGTEETLRTDGVPEHLRQLSSELRFGGLGGGGAHGARFSQDSV